MSNIEQIKELRSLTGAGLADVKEALQVSNGDFEGAKAYLSKKGIAKAEKRSDREANQGIISNYIHTNGRIGVLVEVNCETDFVARNEDFIQFAKDISMQIAAMSPLYVSAEEIPASIKEEFLAEVSNDPKFAGKPDQIKQNIVESKVKSYSEEFCLAEQIFFKDGTSKISDMTKSLSAKVGEAIRIRRFVRYEVGN